MPLFLYRIEPSRAEMPDAEMPEAPTPEEMVLVEAHFNYLQAAYARGQVRYVGRTMEPPHLGLALFEADDAAGARAFLEGDPGVAGGVFSGRAQAFAEIMPFRAG